ncbi:MAG: VCBS repeat-containing protein [Chloracidobacterium sp.]|nr:VCBS repeat-containing protein [Chloracidobacterium sp.]
MKLLPLFLLVTFLSVTTAQGATRTWIGNGADNRLSTPENWIQGIAPITGDDIIFPSFANQYFFLNDLGSVSFNSVTFSGNSYACTGGGSKTLALTVNSGTHNLGPGSWTLFGPATVADGTALTATVSGFGSDFTLDGGGFALLRVKGGFGGRMGKRGSGQVDLDLGDSNGGFAVTVESGRVRVIDSPSFLVSGPLLVTGGTLESYANYDLTSAMITGPNAELTGFSIRATGNLEISDGAKLTLKSCFSGFSGNHVVLRDAYLNPQFSDCGFELNPIIFDNGNSISGTFVGYPDGTVFPAGGRRFKIKYESFMVVIRPVRGIGFDLDRDSRADISIFRPSDGTWYLQPSGGNRATQWGRTTDKPVPGDYDGDERMDLAVYRPAEGIWYILRSLDGTSMTVPFGLENDIPIPLDFDGDGRTDPAVYRPADGVWWIKRSSWSSSIKSVQYGLPGDLPVAADYDGDGRIDVGIFRPSTGLWSHCYAYNCHPISIRNTQWGLASDRPVPADYDGDGKADVAVFRPSEGNWYLFLSSTQSPSIVNWGIATDQPVPADYDGDGRADIGIFRPSDGNWWIMRSTAGVMVQQFGTNEDRPIPGVFVP